MNTFSLILAAIIISKIRTLNIKISPKYENVEIFYYITCVYLIITSLFTGGFQGLLGGTLNGGLISYINQMLSIATIYGMIIFYQKEKFNIIILTLSYIGVQTFLGSRSAVIFIIIMTAIFYPIFSNFNFYSKQLKLLIMVILITSPIMFLSATYMRGMEINFNDISHLIIGRLSMVELSMLPLDCKINENNLCNMDIFYDKYNLFRQILLAVDSLYPGNIFIDDVFPNQYYRSAFLGVSTEFAKENYMSINMSLPTYFYMYTNVFFSIALSATLISIYYYILTKFHNNIYIFLPMLISLYGMLYGFDFVYFFSQIYSCIITIVIFNLYRRLRFSRYFFVGKK
jgi:hypothetical protein